MFQELGQMEQQNRELRALSTKWQVRAEASERGCREAGRGAGRGALQTTRGRQRLCVGANCKQINGDW